MEQTNVSDKLIKDDKGKILTMEIDAEFIKDLAHVMSINKTEWGGKYERNTWKDTAQNPVKIFEAMERHLLDVKSAMQNNKSFIDSTDGASHILKIVTNAMILHTLLKEK